MTRTRVEQIAAENGAWRVGLKNQKRAWEIRARAVVNAAGPWVREVANEAAGEGAPRDEPIRLVKGSHIVVPRIVGAHDAYLCQSPDGRVVFALPFEEKFTLIGTTDVAFAGDPAHVTIDRAEEDYLLNITGQFFVEPLGRSDIVWSYAGVRPLYDDGGKSLSSVTRDYQLELIADSGVPPLLTVLGGKLTTYRRLAEAALHNLAPHLPPMGPAWTARAPLPGGDIGEAGFDDFLMRLYDVRPGFDPVFLRRLARRYGTLVDEVLGDAQNHRDLGADLGGGLTEREVFYLIGNEWAQSAEDVLWRRTKCGLHMNTDQRSVAAEKIESMV